MRIGASGLALPSSIKKTFVRDPPTQGRAQEGVEPRKLLEERRLVLVAHPMSLVSTAELNAH